MPMMPHPTYGVIYVSGNSNPDWELANCQGVPTNAFFYSNTTPDEGESLAWYENDGLESRGYDNHYKALSRVCENCDIVGDCYFYSLKHEEFGYWGGSQPQERKRIRKRLGFELRPLFDSNAYDDSILASREQSTLELYDDFE